MTTTPTKKTTTRLHADTVVRKTEGGDATITTTTDLIKQTAATSEGAGKISTTAIGTPGVVTRAEEGALTMITLMTMTTIDVINGVVVGTGAISRPGRSGWGSMILARTWRKARNIMRRWHRLSRLW